MKSLPASLVAVIGAICLTGAAPLTSPCYCLPQDDCWPSLADWEGFNATVNGRLIATVPVASVCHEPTYNEAACGALRANWSEPDVHYKSTSSMMERYWTNNTCNPFAAPSTPCSLGNLVSYAVNISNAAEIASTIQFAKLHNVRFVVRNTGHDFVGRSTGAGALAVWTHNLKSLEVLQNFTMNGGEGEESYTGPALKMGSGVEGFEAEAFAAQYGLVVVGGWCPSVGIAGGYIQGGGHSPLGSSFGMGADQTLEFEVLTADGATVTASPSENADLYWALSGGGPGTYGVVTSVIVRAYPDLPVGGCFIYIDATLSPKENYWTALRAWWGLLPDLADAEMGATFSYNNSLFVLTPLTAYNKTSEDVKAALKPFTDALDQQNVTYTATFTDFPGYNAHWTTFVTPGPVGGFWQGATRILPRETLANEANLTAFVELARRFADQGVFAGGTAVGAVKRTGFKNAVLPAWRGGLGLYGLLTEWSDDPAQWDAMLEMQRFVSAELSPALKDVTGGTGLGAPGSGSYVNEAGYDDPHWRTEFYGANFERLGEIKQKWDPEGVFWGLELVGSDRREVQGSPKGIGDGKLCVKGYATR